MFEDLSWRSPPARLALGNDEVHVWRVHLEQPPEQVRELRSLLSKDERGRADRFRFERDQRRFMVSHGALRAILARYLPVHPRTLQFRSNAYGKPALAGRDESLTFNLSHSGRLALVAVSPGWPVGVDVEEERESVVGEEIAARFFSSQEVATLRSLPEERRAEAFFLCWTRKEAFVKAVGEGISYPLDQFDVSLTPGAPARLLRVGEDTEEVGRWTLVGLEPGRGYVGALALAGRPGRIRLWQWQTPL